MFGMLNNIDWTGLDMTGQIIVFPCIWCVLDWIGQFALFCV